MTQHEYVFVAISIILGLAITRLLSSVAELIHTRKQVTFHWATALWGASILLFILQLWWVGWELSAVRDWTIIDFFILVASSIFVYGAADRRRADVTGLAETLMVRSPVSGICLLCATDSLSHPLRPWILNFA